ncbi:hypothetical protein Pyrfu_0255 [Pyrolobus fumarii 1A]|uniref:4-vinyl reductase 4VR domain-containing protein n=1 Tax=Pyrolobus fumarii (strain DSM 11204 / 1A) TaxID=694429 RepID=G0EF84_PYRF1|nr:hypothetical protein Pyrfu_0255 [Pyrolobus fumarii 1A]
MQTVSGERVFIMPAVFYKAIFEALQSVAGAAARSLMYYIGVKAGRAMAKDALRVRSGTENIDSVRAIAEILEAMGVGKLESVEKAGSAVKLVLSNTLSGALGIDGGEGCHLERGLVAGMMSEMIGKRVVVKQAQGEKGKCVFEVEVTG